MTNALNFIGFLIDLSRHVCMFICSIEFSSFYNYIWVTKQFCNLFLNCSWRKKFYFLEWQTDYIPSASEKSASDGDIGDGNLDHQTMSQLEIDCPTLTDTGERSRPHNKGK